MRIRLTTSLHFFLPPSEGCKCPLAKRNIIWTEWDVSPSCRFLLASQMSDGSAKLRNNHCRLPKPANNIISSDIYSCYYCTWFKLPNLKRICFASKLQFSPSNKPYLNRSIDVIELYNDKFSKIVSYKVKFLMVQIYF